MINWKNNDDLSDNDGAHDDNENDQEEDGIPSDDEACSWNCVEPWVSLYVTLCNLG